jgi:hypothetical protein
MIFFEIQHEKHQHNDILAKSVPKHLFYAHIHKKSRNHFTECGGVFTAEESVTLPKRNG